MQQTQHMARRHSSAAFTLVEVMMATAIGSLVIAGVLSTYVFSIKAFRAITHYAEIHADGRYAIDVFGRDVRGVNKIVSWASDSLVVKVPTDFDNYGAVTTNKTVSFWSANQAVYRNDSSTGQTTLLATNVYQLTFRLYDRLGSNTTVTANAKGVQVDLKLRKTVVSQIQSEDYLSARLDMRNKP